MTSAGRKRSTLNAYRVGTRGGVLLEVAAELCYYAAQPHLLYPQVVRRAAVRCYKHLAAASFHCVIVYGISNTVKDIHRLRYFLGTFSRLRDARYASTAA